MFGLVVLARADRVDPGEQDWGLICAALNRS